jgi:hypothetical protein
MTKRNAKSNVVVETPSIVLKTIHDDILKANANSTITTKSMRVWLRTHMRDAHSHNASWLFTQSQYDVVRSHFDATYRAKIERASKRNATTRTPRKSRVIDDNNVVVNNELHTNETSES